MPAASRSITAKSTRCDYFWNISIDTAPAKESGTTLTKSTALRTRVPINVPSGSHDGGLLHLTCKPISLTSGWRLSTKPKLRCARPAPKHANGRLFSLKGYLLIVKGGCSLHLRSAPRPPSLLQPSLRLLQC